MLKSVLTLCLVLAAANALRLGPSHTAANGSNPDLVTEALRIRAAADEGVESEEETEEVEAYRDDYPLAEASAELSEDGDTDVGERDVGNCFDNVTLHYPEGRNWRHNCKQYECEPANDAQMRWVRAKPPKYLKERIVKHPPPKLAVLVVAMYGFTNARVWSMWMRNATKSGLDFRFHIHKKNNSVPFQNPEFNRHVLQESAKTRWCKIGDAEWALMEKGLEDPNVTHMAVVSADTIPLKPLSYIYDQLTRIPDTRLCFEWTSDQRAETWWVMQRHDVELLLRHADTINSEWRNRCEEERMWMRPLTMRSYHWGPRFAPLYDNCVMYNHWGQSVCNGWRSHELMGDFHSVDTDSLWKNGAAGHPRTYYNISAAGAQQLQDSVFWWARKFAPNALPKHLFRFRPS